MNDWKRLKVLVGTALILHDYGHLPFSHLLDEVLESINWLPISRHGRGLEAVILEHRVGLEAMGDAFKELLATRLGTANHHRRNQLRVEDIRNLVVALILGEYGMPWIQAIINSPVDIDKVDYLRFDARFLSTTDYPLRPRIQWNTPKQWFSDFLRDQEVNHEGLLCLHGKSAVAAAELWRERIFLYDSFYLAPALRVPERMAFEIIQQFLIRSTMVRGFIHQAVPKIESGGFGERMESLAIERRHAAPIEVKYESVRDVMLALLREITGDEREFDLLIKMREALLADKGIDSGYKDLIESCFGILKSLKARERTLRDVATASLVRDPIVLPRKAFERAREVIRPVQHTYAREVLIDIVRLPRVLGAPRRWRVGLEARSREDIDFGILVPSGPVETWGPKSIASRPVSDRTVRSLERPICRIVVISPHPGRSKRVDYIWDRVRSALLDAGLRLLRTDDGLGVKQ